MEHVINLIGHKQLFENIVSAENCTLTDADGNRYLDLESGVWCASIGHSNSSVTKTINEYANKIMHSGYCYNSSQVELTAEKILALTNQKDGKCVFLCSGSEVVDLGISIAKHAIRKPILLTMSDSYLSAFGNFTNNTTQNWYKFNWLDNEKIENIPFTQISAFIFEPGSSSGLVRFPPQKVIQEIVKRIKSNGGIIIANEVTTGIGRTGKWFGYNHYDIQPDIVAIGKGLGNGYPVSCLCLSKEIVNSINLDNFHYSQSHQNDPMGAAIAYTVLTTIERENLIQRALTQGEIIVDRLLTLKRKYGIIKEIRCRGLMIAMEFDGNFNESIAAIINDKLLEKRIILVKRPDYNILRLDPSLTITDNDIEYFIDSLENILKKQKIFA